VVYLAAPAYGEMFTEAGFGDLVDRARSGAHPRELLAAIPQALLECVCALGDAAAVRARLDAYARAGAAVVGVVPVTAGDPGGARTLGTIRAAAHVDPLPRAAPRSGGGMSRAKPTG
jgi:hypothetical protein